MILVWARGLLRDTAKALLDREMDDPLVGKVREALERVPDTEVTDLHLWRVGRSQYSCILSVVTHQPTRPTATRRRCNPLRSWCTSPPK